MLLRMIKKSVFAVASMATMVVFISGAKADESLFDGLYLKGEVGASISRKMGRILFQDQMGNNGALENNDVGTGATLGLGVGKQFSDNFRAELMFNYRVGNELDTNENLSTIGSPTTADLSSSSLFANLNYDVAKVQVQNTTIVPYIGVGIGFAVNELGDVTEVAPGGTVVWQGDTKTNFAWQIGAGVGIPLTDKLTFDAGYRYVDLGSFQSGTQLISGATGNLQKKVKGDFAAHEVLVGLRYAF